jgi:hypothetical protein
LRGALNCVQSNRFLQRSADFEHFEVPNDIHPGDRDAFAGVNIDKADEFQARYRFANRCATHPKSSAELAFRDQRAGRQLSAHDHFLDVFESAISQRLLPLLQLFRLHRARHWSPCLYIRSAAKSLAHPLTFQLHISLPQVAHHGFGGQKRHGST